MAQNDKSSPDINDMVFRFSKSSDKGTRRYMEDVAQASKYKNSIFFAIFDGHGGKNAARFVEKQLWRTLLSLEDFESEEPEKVKGAIREAFLKTQSEMWNVIENWPKRKNGLQNTSGTTATVAILRGRKLYVAQLGDSGLVLAKKNKEKNIVEVRYVTPEHKPDDPEEKNRINSLGGCVATASGVARVVWKRPIQNSHAHGALRRRGTYEYVPFLAVSRALGDLWSYDHEKDFYLVSPEPDIECFDLKENEDLLMILASDGLWGVVDPQEAVDIVNAYEQAEPENVDAAANLIHKALDKCLRRSVKADNISAITVFFDQQPREGGIVLEDEEEESTVLEEDSEETPPDPPAKSSVPPLKRTRAIRAIDLEDFARHFCSPDANSYIEATVVVDTTTTTDTGVLLSDSRSLSKRKLSSCVEDPVCNSKRNRTISEGGSPLNRNLLTEVSSKSLQSLQLDREQAELSHVAQDFL